MLPAACHPRGMRRRAVLAAAVAGLALAGCGQGPSRPAAATVQEDRASALPPLPAELDPKVVEPVAGAAAGAPEAPIRDPGLDDAGPAPTGPASGASRRTGSTDGVHVSVNRASALPNGIAVPPLEAPQAVKDIIEAGNIIARSPYEWGGGHGKWLDDGYDCSGSVSFALAAAGYLEGPLNSGRLMSWGESGRGKWVTIYANEGHVWMVVAGVRFDTSGARQTGSRWQNASRSTAGFTLRHPPGL
jgi:cell wall-associated NlpC family hydrolase